MLQNNHLSPHAPMGVHFSLFHAKINMQTIIDSLCQVINMLFVLNKKQWKKRAMRLLRFPNCWIRYK